MDNFESKQDDPLLPYRTSQAKPAIITLSILLAAALGGAGYLFHLKSVAEGESQRHMTQIDVLSEQLSQSKQNAESDMANMIATHQIEIERLNTEWKAQVEHQKLAGEEQVKRSFAAVNQIVNQSGETLKTIALLEQKVKEGKALQESEIEDLKAFANGLSYLHQQYEKPNSRIQRVGGLSFKTTQSRRCCRANRPR